MKVFLSIFVALQLLFIAGAQQTSDTCGEVLTATDGGIIYKPFENVQPNERCVWVIRAPNATGYSLDLVFMGYQNDSTETNVVATCLKNHLWTNTHGALNHTGTLDYNICNVVVITFYTSSNVSNSTGFILRYTQVASTVLDPVSSASSDIFISEPLGNFPHGLNATDGVNPSHEISTFVFVPANNTRDASKETNLVVINYGMLSIPNWPGQPTCHDYLEISYFNISAPTQEKYQLQKRFCRESILEFRNNDLILLNFRSAFETPFQGLQLVHTEREITSECNN
ncbi:unnamed protein product [Orchesella dallaii]|uniref:CUB domain-containing protein n=1 Tax=Orchesella dallaii TaxID=48710 RepID=A0ABP1S095_9HEXA